MTKLILLRHAKSAWDDPALDDHDRPLNARGRAAAPRIGAWLRGDGHVPDRILCSTAARAVETARRLDFDAPMTTDRALYLAPARALLSHRPAPGECLLIVAHNPGIAEAAARAVTAPPVHPDFVRYPTAACLVVDAGAGLPGPALAFAVPRDL